MKTRRLGNTDMDFSVIGLGTWAIGGSGWSYGWGAQEEKDSIATVLEALEGGINWIDTAAIYGVGRSEEVVGKAVKEWKDQVYLATKCGLIGDKKGNVTPRLKRDSVLKECEDSLRRLDVETIDLYQIHWPNPAGDIEEAFQALQLLKEQGKIRWAGVSNFSAAQLEQVSTHGHVSSLQPPYSLLKRDVEKDTLHWCGTHQCGVVAYSPMQCGLLTGKVTPEWVAQLPDDDWRKSKSELFKEPKLSTIMAQVDELQAIAAKENKTVAQLAVAWVLRREEVTSAIVGARKPGQITELLPAADWPLSDEQITAIEAVFA